jgi:ribulose-phosphate 3-epimerase
MKNPEPIIISPSLLSADFLHLGEQVGALEAAGADWVHLDVMDGHFVPNLSMGPIVVEACRSATRLPLDVHLMIANPDLYLEAYAKAGADILTLHAETCPHLHRSLQAVRALGCKAGVALNPGTPLNVLEWVLDQTDLVLLLSTNPGFSGQKYLPATTRRVACLHEMLETAGSKAIIMVDGGINPELMPELVAAGARAFVAGNAIFKHPAGIQAGIQALRQA